MRIDSVVLIQRLIPGDGAFGGAVDLEGSKALLDEEGLV